MGVGRVLFKTVRVGLGTAAVFASIQGLVHSFNLIFEKIRKILYNQKKVTSELGVWGRDPNLALGRIQTFVQYPVKN